MFIRHRLRQELEAARLARSRETMKGSLSAQPNLAWTDEKRILRYPKEVRTMKYTTPKLTALTSAISAIQQVTLHKQPGDTEENHLFTLVIACYEDSE